MIKKFFLVLILLITLPKSVNASVTSNYVPTPAISQVYKQGFYKFDNLKDVDISLTLTTDTPTKVMILDKEMNIEFISLIPYNYQFYLRNISPNKIIAIVGDGEVAISFQASR